MRCERWLFPTDYLTEPEDCPPLRVVPLYDAREFRILRCYVNRDGGLVARAVGLADDLSTANAIFGHLSAMLPNGRLH